MASLAGVGGHHRERSPRGREAACENTATGGSDAADTNDTPSDCVGVSPTVGRFVEMGGVSDANTHLRTHAAGRGERNGEVRLWHLPGHGADSARLRARILEPRGCRPQRRGARRHRPPGTEREVITALIDMGADPETGKKEGNSALRMAVTMNKNWERLATLRAPWRMPRASR